MKYTINTIEDRRKLVYALNNFDVKHGIDKSQKSKYEHPIWWFIFSVLNGYNGKLMSVNDIQTKLAYHNVIYSTKEIKRGLKLINEPYIGYFKRKNSKILGFYVDYVGCLSSVYYTEQSTMKYYFCKDQKDVDDFKKKFKISL